MAWTTRDIPDLTGKHAIVTGANSGIGLVTAQELARRGARVELACRSVDRGEAAARSLREQVPSAEVTVGRLDLGSLASVRSYAERWAGEHDALDILVNNAGLMALPRQVTEDGFETQLGVNHLGHFALTARLFPRLSRAPAGRVVTVSSLVHRRGRLVLDDLMGERRYDKWAAYGQSKLANLLFTFELARRLEARRSKVASLAAHPGYSATELQRKGPEAEGSRIGLTIMRVGNALFAQTAEKGALPTLRAATDPGAKNGDYFGPGGPFEVAGAPVKVGSSRDARDPSLGTALWEASERLVGERFEID
jgi:NAD(P)-dependent dehydrogenase (short-subunit alcohol dehydrogenase family)